MPSPREQRRASTPSKRDLIASPDAPVVEAAPAAGKKRTPRQVDTFLKLARDRFQQAQQAEKEQRQRELDDLKFYAGDQWPADIRTSRAGQNASNGMPPTPARPCLTINKTREPVRQVLNQERGSDMGIEIVPADDFAAIAPSVDESEIELREGLVRRIQRESESRDARSWAFARAVQAGRGYYGISTRYVHGKTRDQEIYVRRFYNQACVTLDPAHEQPDGSDAEWGFIGVDMPWDQYQAEFPHAVDGQRNPLLNLSDDEFRGLGEEFPDWFQLDGDVRSCRVVEYYFTERTTKTLYMLADGRDLWEDELSPEEKAAQQYDTREVTEKTVRWAKIDATQILDETEWPGRYIPIVKVLGEELQPYDTQRRVQGMVRPMRDPGEGFNFMVSKWVETIGLSPIPPLMVAEGQVEGYEAWYQAANTRTLPYLPYKTRDLEGNPAAQPFTPPRDVGSVIAPIAGSIQMFSEALQSVSSVHDPSLGKVDHSLKSGKAIQALQQQGLQGTSDYLDNLSRSIRYEGKIINDLLYPIYARPGRLARLVTGEGDPQSVILHQPFVQAPGGKPQPVEPGTPNAKHYTLTKDANFNVIVKVSRDFDSRREQEASILGDLLSSEPQMMTWFGDLYFKNQDGPGHVEMAERAKVMLAPQIQQMLAAKAQGQGAPDPQLQAMQSENQQLKQQLGQASQMLQSEQAKIQAKGQVDLQLETLRQKAETDRQITLKQMDTAAKIEAARITAAKEASNQAAEAIEERLALHADQAHDVGMAAMQQQHGLEASQQAHEQALEQGQASTQNAMAQQANQAALQPPPDQAGGGGA